MVQWKWTTLDTQNKPVLPKWPCLRIGLVSSADSVCLSLQLDSGRSSLKCFLSTGRCTRIPVSSASWCCMTMWCTKVSGGRPGTPRWSSWPGLCFLFDKQNTVLLVSLTRSSQDRVRVDLLQPADGYRVQEAFCNWIHKGLINNITVSIVIHLQWGFSTTNIHFFGLLELWHAAAGLHLWLSWQEYLHILSVCTDLHCANPGKNLLLWGQLNVACVFTTWHDTRVVINPSSFELNMSGSF